MTVVADDRMDDLLMAADSHRIRIAKMLKIATFGKNEVFYILVATIRIRCGNGRANEQLRRKLDMF